MWQRFTERARRVIFFAQEEAARLGESYVGTEHLLLGLVREEDSVAARILDRLDVNLGKIRQEVERQVQRGYGKLGQEMQLTPRAKRVIDLAYDEARQLNNNYIGTEHLLLGLVREGDGLAARVLIKLGADLEKTRREVMNMQEGEQAPSTKTRSRTPTLDEFGRDLTEMARTEKLDPVIGRSSEIERVIQILSRRTKNNPCLIGEPGVGKTAIAQGLAQRIVMGDIPEQLKDKRVVTLDLAGIVAGTKYRGEFEERMKRIMEEVRRASGEVIVFIDELHTLVGAGAAEGAIDASNILKPSLARGEFQCIGATTLDEYRKHIEKDAALERRFQPVQVREPSVDETIEILKGLRSRYEEHHKVTIRDDALEAAARLSDRYISDRSLPDKAIDLIDEAASRVRLQASMPPEDLRTEKAHLQEIDRELKSLPSTDQYYRAYDLQEEKSEVKAKIAQMEQDWQEHRASLSMEVSEDEVANIVQSWTGIPVIKLVEAETTRLLKMEDELHHRVVGQNEAISAIAKAIRRARSGLKDPRRPMGAFIFAGPTGVGKTELARTLAEFLFNDENSLIRIDMSEYMERFAVSRLVGAPPGYVGFEEGGQLTEAVRRRPYSVLLFDEIEKAHPDVFNLLLQVMDEGRLTDAQGRRVDFKNAVMIMTTNAGSSEITTGRNLGFRSGGPETTEEVAKEYPVMKERVMHALKNSFRPEFLNRVDEIIVFHKLSNEQIKEIVDLMVGRVQKQLKGQGMTLSINEAVRDLLAKEGFDPTYGARPLRRAVQRHIEDPLSEEILMGHFSAGDVIHADVVDGKVVFERESNVLPTPVAAGELPSSETAPELPRSQDSQDLDSE